MVEQGDDKACEVLMSARDRFVELDRRLFVRDAEIALARCLLRRGQREACRFHLRAARVIQDEVAAGLPSELGKVFTSAPQQRTIGSIEDELDGRASRAEIEPTTPSIEPARAVSTRRSESWSGRYDSIIGESSKLHRVFKVLDRIAGSDDTVLVYGESGTGKELVAEAIHRNSPRADGPFVKLNCAALVESLLLSELFGHERGAYTGADGRSEGRFDQARGGTIFLDEIGEIPPEMQVKLLRALQEHEFERVGGVATTKVDVRLIAATNQNLEEEARLGRFREDLYYRLAVVPIALPPLRERKDDIPLLVDHFVEKYNRRLGKSLVGLTDDAMACLMNYAWPGNIRELENVMERGVLFAEGARLGVDELPATLRRPPEPTRGLGKRESGVVTPVGPLKEIVKQHTESLERDLINRALEATGGNVTKAAEKLDISRKTLQNKMKDLKLRGADGDEAGGKES